MKQILRYYLVKDVKADELLSSALSNPTEEKLNSLIPGTTTSQQALSMLGSPAQTITQSDKTIFTYSSSDVSREHLVYINSESKVSFVQIVLDQNEVIKTDEIISKYGQPEEKAYSTHAHDSVVYSYPTKGVSFLINGNTNQVFMVQKYIFASTAEYDTGVGKDFKPQPLGDNFQEIKTIKESLLGNNNISSESEKSQFFKNIPTVYYIVIAAVLVAVLGVIGTIIIRKKIKGKNQNEPPIKMDLQQYPDKD